MSVIVAESASDSDLSPRNKPYRPVGNCLALWQAKEPEVLFAGPAGTGKSRCILERLNWQASKYPGMRGLIVRKTRESLTNSGLVTLKNDVIPEGAARWYDNREWQYPNGSVLVTGGMDKPSKIMSSEYDVVYVQEATELSEDDWEHLLTRVRGQAMSYTQIVADCNPAGANHWLLKRAQSGRLRIIDSRHEDNPLLYSGGKPTPFGAEYLAKLGSLTGVRRKRLLLGQWVTAEGVVYEEYDAAVHLVPRFKNTAWGSPPKEWRRFWSIDFGYTHPFVWQAWAQDPETGDLYRFRELYHTGLLVEEVADEVMRWMVKEREDFPGGGIICDHDAEGRATLHKKWGVKTIAAKKSVALGVQAVKKRLAAPSLFYLRDSALRVDQSLADSKRPTCTEDEYELYVWREGVKDSEPVKDNDHGMDATRYFVMHVDHRRRTDGYTGRGF